MLWLFWDPGYIWRQKLVFSRLFFRDFFFTNFVNFSRNRVTKSNCWIHILHKFCLTLSWYEPFKRNIVLMWIFWFKWGRAGTREQFSFYFHIAPNIIYLMSEIPHLDTNIIRENSRIRKNDNKINSNTTTNNKLKIN